MRTTTKPTRAFTAFAGGGAKGLVHVGALRALEGEEVEICGVAGTSAGAIVAALRAAGYRSQDLVAEAGGHTILDELAEIDPAFHSATALFGPGGWTKVSFVNELFRDLNGSRLIAAAILWVSGLAVSAASGDTWSAGALIWALSSLAVVGLGSLWVVAGLANMRRFRNALAELLRRKLGLPEGEVVRFRHFGVDGRPSLKIVAADLTGRKMRLFSCENSAEEPVADAVAASACLPFIFSPWKIDGRLYVDGGLVSNLPAWTFDEERALDPDAVTIAFDIRPPTQRRGPGPLTWPGAAVETALSGAGELNTRAVRGGQLFELESEVDLLAFDMRPADLLEQVRQATKAARVAIRKRIFVDPEIYRDACETMRRSVIEAFQKEASLFETGQVGWIRVAVAIREPGSHQSLRLRFGAGFRRHADRELPLPIKGSVVGAAWKSGKPWLERVPFPPELSLPEERHSALRADVWSSLRWTLCVPILRDGQKEPAFVVTIDGASPLLKSPRVDTFALNLAEDVQDFFRDVVIRLDKQD